MVERVLVLQCLMALMIWLELFVLLTVANTISTLRIRLATGEMVRIDLDNSTETVAQCFQKLVLNGKIVLPETNSSNISETELLKFEIKGDIFHISNDTKIQSLGLKNGEIISISSSKTLLSKSLSSRTSNNITETTLTSNLSGKKKIISNNRKGKIVSIASLQEKKKAMEKITRQKSTKAFNCVYVNPTASVERIMNRIVEHGGIGVLLGKIDTQTQQSNAKYKSKAPIASDVVLSRNVTCIEGVMELFVNPFDIYETVKSTTLSSAKEKSKLFMKQFMACIPSIDQVINTVARLAEPLGLEIVGYCINKGFEKSKINVENVKSKNSNSKTIHSSKEDDMESNVWTSDHVYLSGYFRKLFLSLSSTKPASSNLLKQKIPIILCVSKINSSKSTSNISSVGKSAVNVLSNTTKTASKSSNKVLSGGLSIEAFQLSDQTLKLVDKEYIATSLDKIIETISTNNNPVTQSQEQDQVQLTQDILIKNEETNVVDPLLMVVPLNIIHKQPIFVNDIYSYKEMQTSKRITPVVATIKHNFPTSHEILSSSDMAQLANKYIQQILTKLQKSQYVLDKTLSDKLLDLNLLMYLNNILDADTLNNIVTTSVKVVTNNSSVKLTSRSVMALQMLSSSCTILSDDDDL